MDLAGMLLGNKPLLLSAMALAAMFLALAGVALFRRAHRQDRSRDVIERALAHRAGHDTETEGADRGRNMRLGAATDLAAKVGAQLEHGKFGDSFLATEDKQIVDMCGYENVSRARALFVSARVQLMVLLPLAAWYATLEYLPTSSVVTTGIAVFLGFALGWMLPKWYLRRKASRRRSTAAEELPLLIDLLRLLQGVGLSIDQSLHIVVKEFSSVMPVLGYELRIANAQYSRGRTREQALHKLATAFDNDDLAAICRLIGQVDRHGGAVQDPLARFGERVREKRKLEMKEKIGKLTVKMTGVMVLTLLPALLIVTGGSGFLAIFRALSRIGG